MHKLYIAVIVILAAGLISSLASVYSLKVRNSELEALSPQPPRAEPVKAPLVKVKIPAEEPPVTATSVVPEHGAADDDNGDLDALRLELDQRDDRIMVLRLNLQEAEQKVAEFEGRERQRAERRNRWIGGGSEDMDRLREEDPERYEQVQTERRERRERIQNAIGDQFSFLYNLDQDIMTDAQYANHTNLLHVLSTNWERMQAAGDSPDSDESRQARRSTMGSMRGVRDMITVERDTALQQIGLSLGYDEAESKVFAAQMQHVYDMTSVGTYFRAFRGGRGRGRE